LRGAQRRTPGREQVIQKILIPLDGSQLAEQVIPYAREIAFATGASLVVMSAVQEVGVWDAGLGVAAIEREETLAAAYLESQAEALRAHGLKAAMRLVRGPAADSILAVAADENADLIAIGTRGRSGLSRWVFGSVSAKVIESAERPVLVIRPPREEASLGKAQIKTVLVPLDGSEVAAGVLPFVANFAKALDASVVAYHAVTPLGAYPGFEAAQPAALGRIVEEAQEEARRMLGEVVSELESQGVKASLAVTVDLAVEGICRAAADIGADLIAIGTHGRSGLRRALLGSVADGVVRRSTLPCLLMKPPATGATV
jgi:nucleotide-binding universal stress UspA family protein